MSEIDPVIARVWASIRALKQAQVLGEGAAIPEEDLRALEQAQALLDASISSLYRLAFRRGLDRDLTVGKPISLSMKDLTGIEPGYGRKPRRAKTRIR
jgi:hypothetical protein